ncbi:MAG: heavy metal translocating P-type ATPase, partial [Bifidobacteriaceae bacterium]|nr:heavy metal translocating P-type ATPase [Bifidobacteriaceae bacterium]
MKETFIINGMHCTACARTVEKAVGKLDDVKSARVNFANRKLSVDYTVPAAAGIAKTVQPAGAMAGMGSETEVSSQKTDDSLLKNQLSAASASATSATSTAARSATVIQPAGSMAGMAGMAGMSGMGAGNISASATPTAFEQLVINTVKKAGYIAELPTSEEAQIQTQAQEIRVWGIKTIIGGVLSLPMLYFMFAEVFHWEFLMSVMPIVSLVIATVVQIGLGSTFYQGTWAGLRTFSFNMDSLVAIGTTTAYVFSVVLMFSGFQEMYFETSVLLITFVTFGKWLEARATGKTSSAIRELINLQPKIATLESGETV